VYEGGDGADAMVFAVHADFLAREGQIDRKKIFW
jgi:hypothetical protein